MFDFVHENKRLVQIVLALIILPFAFWGVDSYQKSGGTEEIATVNGSKITQPELENGLRQQQDRLRQMLGANFDPAMFDKPEMKQAVLDNLISQRLLVDAAKAAGLQISDEQIAQVIANIEAFQDGGKFDKKRYESVLATQQMSPPMFEARVRDDLASQQLRDAYLQNGYASNTSTDKIIALNEQQRVVSIVPLSFQAQLAQVKIEDADLKKYYEQNQKEFQLPEQAKVEYVNFSLTSLMAKIEVTAEDARKYYDEHQAEFGAAEERQASHILILAAATAPQAEQDAARAKAQQLLLEVKKAPAKFTELAKQNSQDPGSATNGGDLGFFARGMMVKPFDDAVFALKVGEISDVVKSDFGYHIIKLAAIKPSRAKPLAEVRDEISIKLRQQKAADKFAELAEKFSNTVYEQSDTLKAAAELVGAPIQQSGWLEKGAVMGEPWTAKALEAVFSEDAVKNKRNTPAIEIAPSALLAARVIEHKPASARPFNEVQEGIRQKLVRQQAVELAVKQGKAELDKLQKGEKSTLTWSPAQTLTRAQHGALDKALVRQIFQVNAAKLPQYLGSEIAENGYLLVRVDAVKEAEKPAEVKQAGYAQQLRQLLGEEIFQAYLKDAKERATIKINMPVEAAKP